MAEHRHVKGSGRCRPHVPPGLSLCRQTTVARKSGPSDGTATVQVAADRRSVQRRRKGTQPAPAGSFQGERPSEPAGVQPARTVGPGRRAAARSGR